MKVPLNLLCYTRQRGRQSWFILQAAESQSEKFLSTIQGCCSSQKVNKAHLAFLLAVWWSFWRTFCSPVQSLCGFFSVFPPRVCVHHLPCAAQWRRSTAAGALGPELWGTTRCRSRWCPDGTRQTREAKKKKKKKKEPEWRETVGHRIQMRN